LSLPTEFYTWQSFGTLAGATTATYLVTSTIQRVFDWNPKWLPLLVAELVTCGYALVAGGRPQELVVAAMNGLLVYSAAAGSNVVATRPQADAKSRSRRPRFGAAAAETTRPARRGRLGRWYFIDVE
jgi:hypothetical protein